MSGGTGMARAAGRHALAALLACLLVSCAAGGGVAAGGPDPAASDAAARSAAVTPDTEEAPETAARVRPEAGTAAADEPGAGLRGLANPRWRGLRDRLARDGVSDPRLDAWLDGLDEPTQSPMGRKMRELYRRDFLPKPPPSKKPRLYKGVVTAENAAACRRYVAAHRAAFDAATARYGVPASVAVSLLFVETRLGSVLADVSENAFHTLASMAVSREPADIGGWLARMPGWEKRTDWFARHMPRRAEWAYRETLALARVMLAGNLPPERFPGSVYGAVGLCQFMPSNIPVYGVDGDGDGVVDLFQVDDAVMSLANYLACHGWKSGVTRARQRALLMTYNHAEVYADTILTLADLVDAKPASAPAPAKSGT